MNIKEFFWGVLKKFKIVLLILLTILLAIKLIDLAQMRITAEFDELEPFSNIDVYYKGFKIGRAINVTPSKDFLTTRVTIVLRSWNYRLPNNIKARVQKARNDSDKDYMEIIYPSSPSITQIKYGDKIEGEISHDLGDIISRVAEGGGFDELKGNANNLLSSANNAAKNLSELLDVVTEILQDAHPEITQAAKNLNSTTANLNNMSKKLDNSIDEKYITSSLLNVQNSTKNFDNTSLLLNERTVPAINATICSLKSLIDNLNTIVRGLGNTLSKRMGGARLIFGTPIQ